MKIEPLKHRCIVRGGGAAGNKTETDVTIWNMRDTCQHCGEQLAEVDDLVRHMYEELTS